MHLKLFIVTLPLKISGTVICILASLITEVVPAQSLGESKCAGSWRIWVFLKFKSFFIAADFVRLVTGKSSLYASNMCFIHVYMHQTGGNLLWSCPGWRFPAAFPLGRCPTLPLKIHAGEQGPHIMPFLIRSFWQFVVFPLWFWGVSLMHQIELWSNWTKLTGYLDDKRE